MELSDSDSSEVLDLLMQHVSIHIHLMPLALAKIDITSVFTFLQSFSPSLVHLRPCFSEADIESIEDLHECAKDPETIVQLGHRYVETGKMSPLELKMIEEKLMEVACGMLELEGSDK